ncbi:hypothetical protein ACSVDE_04540 [Pseudalkalibacillus sp. Hm43]|uniref:hypothetical protein n=1 Tax=Pseudalkalibacillus sp. Hm43 TaxID=3450742 RepID=UPI003F43A365
MIVKENICDSCVCRFLQNLEQGTEIRIAIKNTDDFFEKENFFLVCFDPKNCCVTAKRDDGGNIVIFDCRAIAGVQVVNS